MGGIYAQQAPDGVYDIARSTVIRVAPSGGRDELSSAGSSACQETWRVLMVGGGSLLGSMICDLLSKQMGFQLTCTRDSAEIAVIDEIKRIRPHAVILAGADARTDTLRLLAHLDAACAVRIIAFGANDNRVLIYDVKPAVVDAVDELTSIIKDR